VTKREHSRWIRTSTVFRLTVVQTAGLLAACAAGPEGADTAGYSGSAPSDGTPCKAEGKTWGTSVCRAGQWRSASASAASAPTEGQTCKAEGRTWGGLVCRSGAWRGSAAPTQNRSIASTTENRSNAAPVTAPVGEGFGQIGKSSDEISRKLEEDWQSFVTSEMRGPAVNWQQGNTSIEAMSRTQFIALALDKRDVFQQMSAWMDSHMLYRSGPYRGFMAWAINIDSKDKCSTPECGWTGATKENLGPATDGEVWVTTSLLLAGERWSNSAYTARARENLEAMTRQRDGGATPLFDRTTLLPVFVPNVYSKGTGSPVFSTFTDPAYVVPSFFATWSRLSSQLSWSEAASRGRTYFRSATHPSTGLIAENTTFSGSPVDGSPSGNGLDHGSDSIQAAVNQVLDWQAGNRDPSIVATAERNLAFFQSKDLHKMYRPDGSLTSKSANGRAQRCMLGVWASIVPPSEASRAALQALWDAQGYDWYSRQYCLLGRVIVAKKLVVR